MGKRAYRVAWSARGRREGMRVPKGRPVGTGAAVTAAGCFATHLEASRRSRMFDRQPGTAQSDVPRTTTPVPRTRPALPATSVRSLAGQPQITRDATVDCALSQTLRRALLQRHRALGVGNPGKDIVGAGAVLWHGTPAAAFDDRSMGAKAGAKSPTPSPPAWLAGDPAFSAHVSAALHPANQMWLHAYTVSSDLELLAFDGCPDLAAYLGVLGPLVNDVAAANSVLAKPKPKGTPTDGYMLEADSVREQPEYILFAPGLAKLRPANAIMLFEKESRWDQGPGDERSRKHMLGDQHFGSLSGSMTYSI